MKKFAGLKIALFNKRKCGKRDSFTLCRLLKIIADDGRIDWTRAGIMMEVLSDHALSPEEARLKAFLTRAVQHRYAWRRWGGVHYSEYPRGWDAAVYCRHALAAIK